VRAVLTRVAFARVRVDGDVIAEIGRGLCALVGVGPEDTEQDAVWLAEKVSKARLFKDEAGKMNLPVASVGSALLAVSQFTLYGDLRYGNRPSFGGARVPHEAEPLFLAFCAQARLCGLSVQTGRFGANMEVESLNDGPVTLLLDSQKLF
jgi:D-aminoacyl-tRNA deacylase